MNRQDIFIQQLGIGPIWRLSDSSTDISECIDPSQAHQILSSDNTDTNDISVSNNTSVDVLILRTIHQIDHRTSSQINREADLLFERILQAFQLNSQMNITVINITLSDGRDEIVKIIQSTPAKALAVFGVEIARKLLSIELYSIDDSHPQDITTFNQYPLFVFHSPEEILKNSLLKKPTWEKMCMLKSNLH